METTKDVLKVLGFTTLVMVVICGIMLGCTIGINPNEPVNDSIEQTEESSPLEIETTVENGIRLTAGVAVQSDNVITQSLRAIISPDSAPNQAVDWSVFWAEGATLGESDISEYITVVPTSDGALTAIVTCKQSFRDNVAYVKVVTRDGGFEALCRITYVGYPTVINIDTSSLLKDSEVNAFQYLISSNGATLSINLDNAFGDVQDSLYDDIALTVVGYGRINVADVRSTVSAGTTISNEKTLALDDIKDSIFSATYENRQLVITVNKLVENYYESIVGNSSGSLFYGKFQSYAAHSTGSAGVTPYFKATLKLGTLTKEICFRFVSGVSSVSLSSSELVF